MPAFEFELTGLYAAETDEQHKEKQYGLSAAAYGLQNRSGGMYGGNLCVYEIGARTGDHSYHQHPVLEEFDKSAFPLIHSSLYRFVQLESIKSRGNMLQPPNLVETIPPNLL